MPEAMIGSMIEPIIEQKVALVIGAGDATGGAIARRFAAEGHETCVVRRNKDKLAPLVAEINHAANVPAGGSVLKGSVSKGRAHPFGVDARKEEAVVALVEEIESSIGPIDAAIFNIGANIKFNVTETTTRKYFKVWEMGAFAGFLMGREVAKRMIPRGRGSILFTGATASMRGGAGFSAFAGAKHALRALAQSMARELGPLGIHVAHVVIDGAIDTAFIKENFPERYALKESGGILDPDHIAETYWRLHTQPRSAWTHEMDLRPWQEPW